MADQFDAFKKGFDQVMGDSNLADLFTAEEIELLVCGSKVCEMQLYQWHNYIVFRNGISMHWSVTQDTMDSTRIILL